MRESRDEAVGRVLVESLDERWRRFRKKLRALRKKATVDAVHDERTACRRLLSTLGVIEPVIGRKRVGNLERNLKKVLETLGPLRDLHAELDRTKRFDDGPLLKGLRSHLRRQLHPLEIEASRRAAKVRDKRLKKDVQRIEKRLDRLDGSIPKLLERIDAAFSKAVDERRSLDPTDVATLHRLRVAVKNFRYAIEALEPVLRGFDRRRLEELRELQDMLGDLHDLEVLSASCRDFVQKHDANQLPHLQPLQKTLLDRHNSSVGKAVVSADRILKYWKQWSKKGTARLRARSRRKPVVRET